MSFNWVDSHWKMKLWAVLVVPHELAYIYAGQFWFFTLKQVNTTKEWDSKQDVLSILYFRFLHLLLSFSSFSYYLLDYSSFNFIKVLPTAQKICTVLKLLPVYKKISSMKSTLLKACSKTNYSELQEKYQYL